MRAFSTCVHSLYWRSSSLKSSRNRVDSHLVVPRGTSKVPGRTVFTYDVSEVFPYSIRLTIKPRCPLAPPPKYVDTDVAFAFISSMLSSGDVRRLALNFG